MLISSFGNSACCRRRVIVGISLLRVDGGEGGPPRQEGWQNKTF